MRKPIFFLLFSAVLIAQAHAQSTLESSVSTAQQRVWDVGLNLNAAIYKLNGMKLDWQKDKLTAALAQARQDGDTVSTAKIQDQLAGIDHHKDQEKQKLDLNNQLIAAQQQGDQGQVDSILFQLKNLQ